MAKISLDDLPGNSMDDQYEGWTEGQFRDHINSLKKTQAGQDRKNAELLKRVESLEAADKGEDIERLRGELDAKANLIALREYVLTESFEKGIPLELARRMAVEDKAGADKTFEAIQELKKKYFAFGTINPHRGRPTDDDLATLDARDVKSTVKTGGSVSLEKTVNMADYAGELSGEDAKGLSGGAFDRMIARLGK